MSHDPAPLDRLIALGSSVGFDCWPDYLALGLGPEHVPALVRIMEDPRYRPERPLEDENWAPVHAWRALGQLRAAEATGPLLEQIAAGAEIDDDWSLEEVPEVLGMIGPAAIPAVAAFLDDPARPSYARMAAGQALVEIVRTHPEARLEAIAGLAACLEHAAQNDAALNGCLVSDLLDLEAVEAVDVIERAFAARVVDCSFAGDWPEVRHQLIEGGQLPWREPDLLPRSHFRPTSDAASRRKVKDKRKQQKQARKRNRKRR